MSALAVFFERQGIASVVLGLIRRHIEMVQPPRAMWVPFELGRPLGGYVDGGEFQKKVLRSALSLLSRTDGPVILDDFNAEDPGEEPDSDWQAPTLAASADLTDEVRQLQSRWEQACQRLGRTMVGLSRLSVEQAADYLQRFGSDSPAPNPDDGISVNLRLRYSADDIKAYYQEAALGMGNPSSAQIGDWFWGQTIAGRELLRIRNENMQHESASTALVCGKFLVPGARV